MGLDEKLAVIEAQGRQMIEELKRTNKELKHVNETLKAILEELKLLRRK